MIDFFEHTAEKFQERTFYFIALQYGPRYILDLLHDDIRSMAKFSKLKKVDHSVSALKKKQRHLSFKKT